MGRDKARRLSGSRHFRQRLVLATLTSTPVTIVDIRADGTPGLRDHEVSLLRLLDKISDHSDVEINETGTFRTCPLPDMCLLARPPKWRLRFGC
jgi:RNA 3'-terminal phosphate cyclase-like protein